MSFDQSLELADVLMIGLPGASQSHMDLNTAQPPQGPILKDNILPAFLRSKINKMFENIFTPKIKAAYAGMHHVAQNLAADTGAKVQVIDYPEEEKLLELVQNKHLKLLGISMGCENKIAQTIELLKKIETVRKDLKIVLGNVGAATWKRLIEMYDFQTPTNATILSNTSSERTEAQARGTEYYTGEGIHDMRVFIERNPDLGLSLKQGVNAPIIARPVPDSSPEIKSKIIKRIQQRLGLAVTDKTSSMGVSVGCENKCKFCCNQFMFEGKTYLFEGPEELFNVIHEAAQETMEKPSATPEFKINLKDENFTQDSSKLEDLCQRIEESGENIRFMTFGTIKGLHEYRKAHGDFRKFVRGGLNTIWIGVESIQDVFNKRGGASPEDVEEIIKDLQSLGITVITSFINGLPDYHNPETLKKDREWSIKLGAAARQVVTNITLTLSDPSNTELLSQTDEEFGCIPNREHANFSKEELIELDKLWREELYLENGPVSFRSLIVMWDGYQNLSKSEHPADQRAATFYYWMVKRYFTAISFATLGFNETFFKKHSDEFLQRLAKLFHEFENCKAPDKELDEKYQLAFRVSESEINPIARHIAGYLRRRFVRKHLPKE